MKILPLLALCAILSAQACTEDKPAETRSPAFQRAAVSVTDPFTYIRYADTLDWRTVEARVDLLTKERAAAALTPAFADYVSEYVPRLPLLQHLHLLDLNGDKQLDAVYNGPWAGEGNIIRLWINDAGRYRSLFGEPLAGQVKQLEIRNGRLTSLTVLDFGCCAEYIEVERTYAFDAQLKPCSVLQRGTAAFTQRPHQGMLSDPTRFQTITDSAVLRALPLADDTSTLIYDAVGKGNGLLKLGKGAKGWAWTSKLDTLRQSWYYVELMPVKNLKGYLMYEKDSIPTRAFGWVRANDIQY